MISAALLTRSEKPGTCGFRVVDKAVFVGAAEVMHLVCVRQIRRLDSELHWAAVKLFGTWRLAVLAADVP
jgi:hypothetical protein